MAGTGRWQRVAVLRAIMRHFTGSQFQILCQGYRPEARILSGPDLSRGVRSSRERICLCGCQDGLNVSPVSLLSRSLATMSGQFQKALERQPPRNGSIVRSRRNLAS